MAKRTLEETLAYYEKREIKVKGRTYTCFIPDDSGNMRIHFQELNEEGENICFYTVDFYDDGRIFGTVLRDYEDYGDDCSIEDLPKSVVKAIHALGKALFF